MADEKKITADRAVDALYAGMRGRFGTANSRANGYVYEGYFRREQALLLSLLNPQASVVVDVGCGSGLMLQPLIELRAKVIGIDFNRDACLAAKAHGLDVLRGDAFNLPLADASIDELVTCQFFNQQTPAAVEQYTKESARVLRPGGKSVMVWRNGSAWVHRIALAIFGRLDRLRGRDAFPYENHGFEAMRNYAHAAGLAVRLECVSFPPLNWQSQSVNSVLARAIGASNICVLQRD